MTWDATDDAWVDGYEAAWAVASLRTQLVVGQVRALCEQAEPRHDQYDFAQAVLAVLPEPTA